MARIAGKRSVSRQSRGQKLPNYGMGGRNKPFHFQHNHGSWELVETSEGWRLVPSLSRIVVAPGVNGTAQAKRGQHLSAVHVKNMAEENWGNLVLTDIDAYQYSPEEPGSTGDGYFTLWETVLLYDDGTWEIDHDDQGWADWRWSLVVNGTIKPPRKKIWSTQERRWRTRIQRASRRPDLSSSQQSKTLAERMLEGLAEAKKAMDALNGPTPKRKARVVRKKAPAQEATNVG